MTQPSELSVEWPDVAEASGLRLIGYTDLEQRPGFKLAIHEQDGRWYLYVAHFWESGWSVVDVTDPRSPQVVGFWSGPTNTWTLQVQAADGLLITGLEYPVPGWGFDDTAPSASGVDLYDIASDPTAPSKLGEYRFVGRGTHRNHFAGGSFLYMAANLEGFAGNFPVILDISNPMAPVEVSRWWFPGQHVAGGEHPEFAHYLHGPAYRMGDLAYLGYGGAGFVILDLSDITQPSMIGRLPLQGFGSILGAHSAVPIPGGDLVVVNSEAINEDGVEGHNYAFIVDVSDPRQPYVVGSIPTPRPESATGLASYFEKAGRFGPHNQHHPQHESMMKRDDLLFMTYFNAGLRVFDISEPRSPTELEYYVPVKPLERRGTLPLDLETQFEDVLVDRRGFAYCTDKNWGLFVLESDALRSRLETT